LAETTGDSRKECDVVDRNTTENVNTNRTTVAMFTGVKYQTATMAAIRILENSLPIPHFLFIVVDFYTKLWGPIRAIRN